MGIDPATAMMGASLASSALGAMKGNKDATGGGSQSGFAALPKEVQDFLLQTYLPKVQNYANMPFQAAPMQRADTSGNDIFASQGLSDLQKFSDAAGGYFTPYSPMGAKGNGGIQGALPSYGMGSANPNTAPTASNGTDPSALASQYLSQVNGANRGSPYANQRGISNAVSTGMYSLPQLGQALSSSGYSAGSSPGTIDLAALSKALGR